jgi:hypothetical protein
MRNTTKTTVILKAFDIKLRAMLQEDLKNFKIKNQKNNYSTQAA